MFDFFSPGVAPYCDFVRHYRVHAISVNFMQLTQQLVRVRAISVNFMQITQQLVQPDVVADVSRSSTALGSSAILGKGTEQCNASEVSTKKRTNFLS